VVSQLVTLLTAYPYGCLKDSSGFTRFTKSKKRVRDEALEASDEDAPALPPKKIDLGVAISNLTREMEGEGRAIKLLEAQYQDRLDMVSFIGACTFFKDERNVLNFVTLTNVEMSSRDRLARTRASHRASQLD
jgi:hypothetical protein